MPPRSRRCLSQHATVGVGTKKAGTVVLGLPITAVIVQERLMRRKASVSQIIVKPELEVCEQRGWAALLQVQKPWCREMRKPVRKVGHRKIWRNEGLSSSHLGKETVGFHIGTVLGIIFNVSHKGGKEKEVKSVSHSVVSDSL